MPKPIVFIQLPRDTHSSGHEAVRKSLDDHEIVKEYYVLVTVSPVLEKITMQVFYEKDFDNVKY